MIYLLHDDARECAKMLADDDLKKQIKAIAQTLCNVHWLELDRTIAQGVEINHIGIPLDEKDRDNLFTQWTSECRASYLKLLDMGMACIQECYHRWNEPIPENTSYKYAAAIEWAWDNVPDLKIYYGDTEEARTNPKEFMEMYLDDNNDGKTTPFPLAMPEKYISYKGKSQRYGTYTDEADIIKSYRNYYCAKIKPDAKYTRREKPEWITNNG
jgi:hypothetical protein